MHFVVVISDCHEHRPAVREMSPHLNSTRAVCIEGRHDVLGQASSALLCIMYLSAMWPRGALEVTVARFVARQAITRCNFGTFQIATGSSQGHRAHHGVRWGLNGLGWMGVLVCS